MKFKTGAAFVTLRKVRVAILCLMLAGALQAQTLPVITEFMAANSATLKDENGDYSDWLELYNPATTNINLNGWHLTDDAEELDKWSFPSTNLTAGKYIVVFASSKNRSVTGKQLHTNFKLGAEGEYLALVRPDGATMVCEYAPVFPPQYTDISYGIGPSDERIYFSIPTPGSNNLGGIIGVVADTKFSVNRGLYTNAVTVAITTATTNAQIRYTLDSSTPTVTNALYSTPLTFSASTVLRAKAFKNSYQPTGVDTHAYIQLASVLTQPSAPGPGFPAKWQGVNSSFVIKEYTADYAMSSAVVNNQAYNPLMTNALKCLPTISLVTARTNLFSYTKGIYDNAWRDGIAWERPASCEWIVTNNTTGFQVDCGLRMQGGWARMMEYTRKLSFRMLFKDDYGPTKLQYKLFDDETATDSFDTLICRGSMDDSFADTGLNDEFVRRCQQAMGQPSIHGTFAQLYLDGLYWGLYNVTEKGAEGFGTTYFGGDKDDWDVVISGVAAEGSSNIWNAFVAQCQPGVPNNAAYQRLQGRNPDGSRNAGYTNYVDMANYIDYLIIEMWSGNSDWPHNNWTALRNRTSGGGFRFCVWDAELALTKSGLTFDRTHSWDRGPGVCAPYEYLRTNTEFKVAFSDHLYKVLFNNGVLTPAAVSARFQSLVNLVDPAVVAESARWGDMDGSFTLDSWRVKCNNVLNNYLPQRSAVVLQQFKDIGLYPAVAAPVFSQQGGMYADGFNLAMSAANTIYYTLDGSDPREIGTGRAVGIAYTNSIALPCTAQVKARAMVSTNAWSALNEALFVRDAPVTLAVTEVMYNPRAPSVQESSNGWSASDFEFVEVRNIGAATVGLAGTKFTAGVPFDFSGGNLASLAPGAYAVVVHNRTAFTNRYALLPGIRIAGEFQSAFELSVPNLGNDGEHIRLEGPQGETLAAFTYGDGYGWPPAADGAGHALVPLIEEDQTDGTLDHGWNWRASTYRDGSPGAADPAPLPASIVLNEIMAHTDTTNVLYDSNDWIELFNCASTNITMGVGWYLSDDADDLKKWMLPATNTLAGRGWRTFDEITSFHTNQASGFGLSKYGDNVFLSYLPGTAADRVADGIAFTGQERDRSFGRFADGTAFWTAMAITPNASNRLMATADVQIDELMYHPQPTVANPENNLNDEYVELHNPTTNAITLDNPAEGGPWRLSGQAEYTFPSNTVLPAGGYLVIVSFAPTNASASNAFMSAYALTGRVTRLLGPYAGQLDNDNGRIVLERPVKPDLPGDPTGWFVVDEAVYTDASPWPTLADGTGRPLQRIPGRNAGNNPASWNAGLVATPGYDAVKLVLSNPRDGTGFMVPFTVTLTADVDLNATVGSVQQVEFFDGATSLFVDAVAPYELTLGTLTNAGAHVLSARLTDDAGTNASPPVRIYVYTNAPATTPGVDRKINILYHNSLNLDATLDDRGLPPSAITTVWSKLSGPGNVVFGNAAALDTSATFASVGTYVLCLTTIYDHLILTNCLQVMVTNVNTRNTVPYHESFEGYLNATDLAGLDGWYAPGAGVAMVLTNAYTNTYAGTYPLTGVHQKVLAVTAGDATCQFRDTQSKTNIWIDMLVAGARAATLADPWPETQLALCVKTNGHLMVWHGGTNLTSLGVWAELQDTYIASNEFARLTLQCDYTRNVAGFFKFRLWLRGVAITNPATWFATASTNRSYLSQIVSTATIATGVLDIDDLVVDERALLTKRITATSSGRGQIAPAGDVDVEANSNPTFTFTPSNWYCVAGVQVDGGSVGVPVTYTFTNVSADHALHTAFGAVLAASNTPKWWLAQWYPTNSLDAAATGDSDGDGRYTWQEYIAGTHPTNGNSVWKLAIGMTNGQMAVWWPTIPAGNEYDGQQRYYSLEGKTNLVQGNWAPIAGNTNMLGTGQAWAYTNNLPGLNFFRGQVFLK